LGAIERSSLAAACVIFVPGHAGMKNNEHMDRLAVVMSGIAINCTDIPDVLRDNCRVSDEANDSECTTMNRLYELHVKAGSP
jgi:hypothetical protein